LVIPEAGEYLWNWYFDISQSIRRVHDGVCVPIPPSEFTHWRFNTATIVTAPEYAILRAMDRAYCAAMNIELGAFQVRQREQAGRDAKKGR
jgi:hypothetical protein